jgi:hypothetical protein
MAKWARSGTWQFSFLNWFERFFLMRRRVRVMVVDNRRLLLLARQETDHRVQYRTR